MKATHSLLISCILALSLAHSASASNHPRQIQILPTVTSAAPAQTSTTAVSSTSASSTTPSATTSTSPPSTSSTSPSTSSAAQTSTSSASVVTTPPSSTTLAPQITQILSTSTDAAGNEATVTVTNQVSSTSSAAPSSAATNKAQDSSSLGTGSIIGIAVAGGVAVIGIVGFFVWKFTRRRFTDFDDNEAIKWPELNSHGANIDSHPLPVHNTGRSGFDTGSDPSLSRAPTPSNFSTTDVSGGIAPDPYAVPPLPHLNPNQPYRDDPTAATGYYDPYRGPVPGTIENGAGVGDWSGEAIPMTQMHSTSPGPNAGRMSPGPQAAYGGRTSPGPQAAFGGGRSSPGPHAAYPSPGRMSPGPQAAYDPYGGR